MRPVNATVARPEVQAISPALRARIESLNTLDIKFYDECKIYLQAKPLTEKLMPEAWQITAFSIFEKRPVKTTVSDDLRILAAAVQTDPNVRKGDYLRFELEIEVLRPIQRLEIGIHIFDADGQWAFGTNSTLLGAEHSCDRPGKFKATYNLIADLPIGAFTAGFAFADRTENGTRTLVWHDVLASFHVAPHTNKPFAGYADLPTQIGFTRIGDL